MQIRDAMHTSILSVSPQAPISEATKLRTSHGHPTLIGQVLSGNAHFLCRTGYQHVYDLARHPG
jgi:hypothetical protein